MIILRGFYLWHYRSKFPGCRGTFVGGRFSFSHGFRRVPAGTLYNNFSFLLLKFQADCTILLPMDPIAVECGLIDGTVVKPNQQEPAYLYCDAVSLVPLSGIEALDYAMKPYDQRPKVVGINYSACAGMCAGLESYGLFCPYRMDTYTDDLRQMRAPDSGYTPVEVKQYIKELPPAYRTADAVLFGGF